MICQVQLIFEEGKRPPHPQDFSLFKKTARFTKGQFRPCVVKCTGRGLVVKRQGVLSKVQMLNLVLGVGVFSLLPIIVLAVPAYVGSLLVSKKLSANSL